MRIIEIAALENGAHRNQTCGNGSPVPDGWAVIPEHIVLPDTFPFVNITVDVSDEDGAAFVTEMTEGVVPDPEPEDEPADEASDTEVLNTLLGVNE